jgi:MFS family permease
MKRFLIIALSQLISLTGSTLTQFALPLWIYLQTGSLTRFGLIAVAGLIPGIVISPLAGTVVDRSDRRKVMIAGDLASAVTIGIMLALVSAGHLGIWQIYLLIGCLSVSLAFQRTAYLSAVPQVVPKRYLGNANGVIQAAGGVAQFIAPVTGVGLLAAIGLRGILVFDVVSYAVAIVTAVLVRFPAAMAFKRAETLTAEIRFGFRYVIEHRSFLALVLFSAAINFFLAPLLVLISPLVLSFSTLPAVAPIAAAAGIGAIAADLAMVAWGGPAQRRLYGIRVILAVMGLSAILTGLRPSLPLIATGVFLTIFCLELINGIFLTIVQTKLPQRIQGRMIAVLTMIATISVPFALTIVMPIGPRLLNPLTTASGPFGTIIRAIAGTGHDRGIALVCITCGLAIALLTLAAGRSSRIARFDTDVLDAIPDDILGLQVLRHRDQSL